ncbi:MAG: PRC-barrel domain-containing protein [Chloroflexi bacterium]|nr:PRC-barrel domain-containing protein [Chloroflexota bacterium]
MKAATLRGKPVISLAEASKLGYVNDLHLDPNELRVVALRIGSNGHGAMIPFGDIQSIGDDAVTIPNNQCSRVGGTNGTYGSLPDLERLRKLKVVDENGTYLGMVGDVEVDRKSGRIVELLVKRSLLMGMFRRWTRIPARAIRSVGPELLIVKFNEPNPTT